MKLVIIVVITILTNLLLRALEKELGIEVTGEPFLVTIARALWGIQGYIIITMCIDALDKPTIKENE